MTGEEHIIEEDCWLLVFLMRPLVMLLLVIGYLKSEPYVAKLRTKLKLRKKANKRLFTLTVVAHNVAFLGLPPPSPQRWQRALAQPRANRRQAGGAALLPETAAFLRAFYAPYNAQLAYWLADDRWLWEDVHAAQHAAASNATRE